MRSAIVALTLLLSGTGCHQRTPAVLQSSQVKASREDSATMPANEITEAELTRAGFYERKARFPAAIFLGPAELRDRIASDSTNLVPETDWVKIGASMPHDVGGGLVVWAPQCVWNVWVNGALSRIYVLDHGPFPADTRFGFGRDVAPATLAALEVYSWGSPFPEQFKPASRNCGSVLLWTKTPEKRAN